MRRINITQKLMIYFNTSPFIISEGFVLLGVIIPIVAYPNLLGLFALLFTFVGAFLVKRKINMVKTGSYVVQYGIKSSATVSHISETSMEHSGRSVKEYRFQYMAEGKRFDYEHISVHKRILYLGSEMTLYYLKENPRISFIPKLYNIDVE